MPSYEEFLSSFPGLGNDFSIESPASPIFNCIAYAADDYENWWWPFGRSYWPIQQQSLSIQCFVSAFETLGYTVCNEHNSQLEDGYEKVAIYADSNGEVQHMARQQPNGAWKSKCGKEEDILHALTSLEGNAYGKVVVLLRRPIGRPVK